jgi:hypothetical protein
LWKNRWFWVVFASFEDVIYLNSSVYGYESTAAAAEARARQVAGPGAWKAFACDAQEFRRKLRAGTTKRWRPPPPAWCVKLGLTLPCGIDEVKAAYRRRVKEAHPDAGGKAEDFIAIESAYRTALDYCQRYGPHLAS